MHEQSGSNRCGLMRRGAKACLLVLLAACLVPAVVRAHPETGEAPDGVAETEYRIALEMNPKDVRTRIRLGMLLARKNKLKEAERELAVGLRQLPDDFLANYAMGSVRLREKKAEAVAWFRKALSIKPDDPMAHYNLGQSLELAGRPGDAEGSYRRALEANEAMLRQGKEAEHAAERRKIISAALENLRKNRPTR